MDVGEQGWDEVRGSRAEASVVITERGKRESISAFTRVCEEASGSEPDMRTQGLPFRGPCHSSYVHRITLSYIKSDFLS